MTRKHFRSLADALASVRPNRAAADRATWEACLKAVARACKEHNPHFDSARFVAWASGTEEE